MREIESQMDQQVTIYLVATGSECGNEKEEDRIDG
jgi:hypothetical protein